MAKDWKRRGAFGGFQPTRARAPLTCYEATDGEAKRAPGGPIGRVARGRPLWRATRVRREWPGVPGGVGGEEGRRSGCGQGSGIAAP